MRLNHEQNQHLPAPSTCKHDRQDHMCLTPGSFVFLQASDLLPETHAPNVLDTHARTNPTNVTFRVTMGQLPRWFIDIGTCLNHRTFGLRLGGCILACGLLQRFSTWHVSLLGCRGQKALGYSRHVTFGITSDGACGGDQKPNFSFWDHEVCEASSCRSGKARGWCLVLIWGPGTAQVVVVWFALFLLTPLEWGSDQWSHTELGTNHHGMT